MPDHLLRIRLKRGRNTHAARLIHGDESDYTMTAEQGTHFWFMAIQAKTQNGYVVSGFSGTCTPQRGQTRLDILNLLRDWVDETNPADRGGVVIAFDIQPNKI